MKKKLLIIGICILAPLGSLVALLFSFMMGYTFWSDEPTLVETPTTVVEEKMPMEHLVTILVSGNKLADGTLEGKVFIGITGSTDSVFSNEMIRRDVLLEAIRLYNAQPSHANSPLFFTEEQIMAFTKIGMFGVPMKDLPEFLGMSTQNAAAYAGIGIPFDENNNPEESALNEFQIWMRAVNNVALDYKDNGKLIRSSDGHEEWKATDALFDVIKCSGAGIAVKGDKDTPYSVIHPILDNLQTIELNKFTLVTALNSETE